MRSRSAAHSASSTLEIDASGRRDLIQELRLAWYISVYGRSMLCHRLLSLVVRLGSWSFLLRLWSRMVRVLAIEFGLRGEVRLSVEDIILIQGLY